MHGNTLKKEKTPDGSKDENVFDIRQGVAIALFIKKKVNKEKCRVLHFEKWGLRNDKYEWLDLHEINTVKWSKLSPNSPYYFFVQREERNREVYESFLKITDIFSINVTGIVTARDKFVIDFNKDELIKRLEIFRNTSMPDEMIRNIFKLKDTRGWILKEARQKLINVKNLESNLEKILYRPFDERFIYYSIDMVDWPRPDVMVNLLKDNLSICFMRQVSLDDSYTHFIVSKHMVDNRTFLSSKGIIQQAPLYLYNDEKKRGLFSESEDQKPKPNLSHKIYNFICHRLNDKRITPEEIFYFIYAVLYSNIFREKYAEFLRIDFPRIPFTSDYDLFIKMGKLGQQLAEIHLMKSSELNQTFSRFEVSGNNIIKKVKYNESEKNVYINDTQYFSKIEKEIWEYQIGGYQVMNKWLKDRKKRNLSLEDIQHYIKIARALQLTIQYQQKIDDLYDEVEKNLIKL